MAKFVEFIKKRKLFSSLIFILILGFISSFVFIVVLDKDSMVIMENSINTYFNNIKSSNINYIDNLSISLVNNILISFIIWILGISIIGCLVIYLIYFIKCFTISLSFISIIKIYGVKGIVLSIIYIIPYIINIGVLFILSYYAISFSILLFKYLFRGVSYNRKVIVKRYFKVLLVSIIILIISSLLDVFIVPRILLLF